MYLRKWFSNIFTCHWVANYFVDEIALDDTDCPLEIAINAVNIPRFVLRLKIKDTSGGECLPSKLSNPFPATAQQGSIDQSHISEVSNVGAPFVYQQFDHREHEKALAFTSIINTEPFPVTEPPKKLKKAKRTKSFLQMVRKKKGGDAADSTELSTYRLAPGILKVYGDHVSPGSNYKSVRASTISTAKEVVKQAVEKYGIEDTCPTKFVLCDVVGHFNMDKGGKDGQDFEEAQWVTECMRVVNENERPLVIQSLWKPAAGRLRRFELMEKSQMEVGCFYINTAENIRKDSALSSPTIDSERSSVVSEQVTNESASTDNQNSNGKASSEYAPNEYPQSFVKKIPYLLLIKGVDAISDQLVYPLAKPNLIIGNPNLKAASTTPDICLFASDIASNHCYIHKKIGHGKGSYDTNIDEVEVSVFIEPASGCYVDVNGIKIEQLTMLSPGQLVSFGDEYCFIFKDPSQVEDRALKLTWLELLKQSVMLTQQNRYSDVSDSYVQTDIEQKNSDEVDFGSGIESPATVVGEYGEFCANNLKRSPVMLMYDHEKEDELLDKIVHILGMKSFKLTPAYLLVMMIEHSCATFHNIHVRKFLLKVSSALQSIAWVS